MRPDEPGDGGYRYLAQLLLQAGAVGHPRLWQAFPTAPATILRRHHPVNERQRDSAPMSNVFRLLNSLRPDRIQLTQPYNICDSPYMTLLLR